MKQPLVYIIILNWNGIKDTIECIESIRKIDYKNYKLLVIDNNSSDGSVEVLTTKYPNIKIIKNKTNLGYAGGNNVGIKYILKNSTDYILLLNNDTVVDKKWLSELILVAERSREIGIVGPRIYYYSDPTKVWFAGGDINLNKGPFIHRGNYYLPKSINIDSEVDFITGCSMLVKASVFKSIPLLDDSYFAYVEDVDFNFKAKKAGFKSVYASKSKIWHKESASSGGEEGPLKHYLIARNQILFAKKNLKGKEKTFFFASILFNRFKKIILFSIDMKFKKINATIMGLIDGIFSRLDNYNKYFN